MVEINYSISHPQAGVRKILTNNQLFVVKLRCSSKLSPSIPVRLSAWAPNIFFRHFFGFSRGAVPAPESFSDWFYEKLPRALVKFCWVTKSLIFNSLGYTSVAKRSSGRHFWLLKCSSPITYTEEGAGDADPQEFTPEYIGSLSRFCSFFSDDFSL